MHNYTITNTVDCQIGWIPQDSEQTSNLIKTAQKINLKRLNQARKHSNQTKRMSNS